MEKVRFTCPRCSTVMQAASVKIGSDVGCPQCGHEFRLVDSQYPESGSSGSQPSVSTDAPTMPPRSQTKLDSSGSSDTVDSSSPSSSQAAPGSAANLVSGPAGSSYMPPQESWHQPTGHQSGDAYAPPNINMGHAFACPYCRSTAPPNWKSEVSHAGWIVFAVLFCTTCFGCIVGLFMRDRYRVCSKCKVRLE